MRKHLLWIVALLPTLAAAQVGSPLPSTAYTRQLLRSANSNAAWLVLGLAPTNVTKITNVITQVDAGTTNAWKTDATNIAVLTSQNPSNSVQYSRGIMHHGPPMHFNGYYLGMMDTNAAWPWIKILTTNGYDKVGYNTLVFDGGWQATTRDANGDLQADAVNFPDGMSNFVKQVHAYNPNMRIGLYTVPYDSIPSLPTLKGTGPANIERDAQTFANWGIDFIKFDDIDLRDAGMAGYLQRFAQAYQFYRPTGCVRAGFGSYCNLDQAPYLVDWCTDYQSVTNGWAADLHGFFGPSYGGSDGQLGDILQFLYSADNAMYFNSKYLISGAPGSADALPLDGANTNRMQLVMSYSAVASITLEMKHVPVPTDGAYWTLAAPIITNTEAIAINQDCSHNPYFVADVHGPATAIEVNPAAPHDDFVGIADPTGYSIVAKRLVDNTIAVALFNRNTNANTSTNLTLYATNLHLANGAVFAVRDIWRNTNGWATNALTMTISNLSGSLLRVYPTLARDPAYTLASSTTPANVAYTNVAQTFSGKQFFNNRWFLTGSDDSADTFTPNQLRRSIWGGPNFSGTDQFFIISWYMWANGDSRLELGGDQAAGANYGPEYIYFETAASANSAPVQRWVLDNAGTFYPVATTYALGSTTKPVDKSYHHDVLLTNTPNVSAAVANFGKLVMSNSCLYFVTSAKTNLISDGR